MKKFVISILLVAIIAVLYGQVNAEKKIYVLVIAVVIFMFGMMKLSAKTPSKNQDKEDKNV